MLTQLYRRLEPDTPDRHLELASEFHPLRADVGVGIGIVDGYGTPFLEQLRGRLEALLLGLERVLVDALVPQGLQMLPEEGALAGPGRSHEQDNILFVPMLEQGLGAFGRKRKVRHVKVS